jgi:hypothetical protein
LTLQEKVISDVFEHFKGGMSLQESLQQKLEELGEQRNKIYDTALSRSPSERSNSYTMNTFSVCRSSVSQAQQS